MTQRICKSCSCNISEPTLIDLFSESYGRLYAYEKSYDRITTKTEKPLQLVDRIKYNTTTSDDPVMQDVRSNTIFADEILTITH